MFSVGQRVICVDDSLQPHTVEELKKDVPNFVKKGQKYTIRDIVDHDFVVGVRLEEVTNPIAYFKIIGRAIEPCFASWRFRALQEDEVEVEVEQFEEVY